MTLTGNRLRLMLVTDERLVGERDWVAVCQAAVRGGVTAVQVRHKTASGRALADLVRRLREALACPIVVNDRLDVALAAGANGVHLGADDVSPSVAAALRPPGFLVGASVGTDAEIGDGSVADYWGVGPFRSSGTKPDAGAALGPEGLGRIVARAGGRPCLAIGGVRPEDVAAAIEAGAMGVAVVAGILEEEDVEAAARRYAQALAAASTTGGGG